MTHYNVEPRYTPGSPAMVSYPQAKTVARDEREAYQACLEGLCGPEQKARAEELGLKGIVEERHEEHNRIYYHDLITDERGTRPLPTLQSLRDALNRAPEGTARIMERMLTEQERTTLVSGLRVAAERYAEHVKTVNAEAPQYKSLAEQFERQRRDAMTLAERIEDAGSIILRRDEP